MLNLSNNLYPDELLPKPEYEIKYLNDLKSHQLLRDTPDKNLLDNNQEIKIKYIADPTSNLADYSTNLFGENYFNQKHLGYQLQKIEGNYYHQPWNVGTRVKIPSKEHITIKKGKGYFLIDVDECLKCNIHHQTLNTIITSKITHTPTNCNYWHTSIHWYNGDELIKSKSKILKTNVKVFIKNIAINPYA